MCVCVCVYVYIHIYESTVVYLIKSIINFTLSLKNELIYSYKYLGNIVIDMQ